MRSLLAVVLLAFFVSAALGQAFIHPGGFAGKAQLDLVKAKIAAKQEPWYTAFVTAKGGPYGSLSKTPNPVSVVTCPTSGQKPVPNSDTICGNLVADGQRAYVAALIWYYTGDAAYGNKAISYLDAHANTLTKISFDMSTASNGIFEADWTAPLLRGAEIMRTSSLWPAASFTKFKAMVMKVYYPLCIVGWGNANGLMAGSLCTMEIAVLTDNRTMYNGRMELVKNWIVAASYITADGTSITTKKLKESLEGWDYAAWDTGKKGPMAYDNADFRRFWNYPSNLYNGMWAETCRDMGHAYMGIEAAMMVAELAYSQGDASLYDYIQTRMVAVNEYHSGLLNFALANPGKTPSNFPTSCALRASEGTTPSHFTVSSDMNGSEFLGSEIAYNHFAIRKGISMPATKALLTKTRPTRVGNHIVYETLTHGSSFTVAAPTTTTTKAPTKAPTTTKAGVTTTTKAPTVTTQLIYKDTLAASWSDQSYGSPKPAQSTTTVHTGTSSYTMSMAAPTSIAIQLMSDNVLSTANFGYLRFYINGGAVANADVKIKFASGSLTSAVSITPYVDNQVVPKNAWARVLIPASKFAITSFNVIAFKANTAATGSIFIDDIALILKGAPSTSSNYTEYSEEVANTTSSETSESSSSVEMVFSSDDSTAAADDYKYYAGGDDNVYPSNSTSSEDASTTGTPSDASTTGDMSATSGNKPAATTGDAKPATTSSPAGTTAAIANDLVGSATVVNTSLFVAIVVCMVMMM